MKHSKLVTLAIAFLLVLSLCPQSGDGRSCKLPRSPKRSRPSSTGSARPEAVEKFGQISDMIWEYAELGLQEFN